MKQNIFIIGYDTAKGDEDIITSYWSYLLEVVPGLGQAFVDHLVASAGLPPTEFIGVLDHPTGDAGNHPDLLLQCRDWQVLFEHKVDAPLGPQQVERYKALAASRGWKLALLAAAPVALPADVLGASNYAGPRDSSGARHFLWGELLPLLRASGHHLATEFAEFLEYRGLCAYSWAGRGNPFFDDGARRAMLELYNSVGTALRPEATRCSYHAKSLVYKVSYPHRWIHLLNFGPLRSVAQQVPHLRGPVLAAWFWIKRTAANGPRRLPEVCESALQGTELPIAIWNRLDAGPMGHEPKVFNEREYYVPLDLILVDDLEEASRRVLAFVRAALEHVRRDLDDHAAAVRAGRAQRSRQLTPL